MILALRNGSILLRGLTNAARIVNTSSNRTLFRAPRHRSITGNKYAPPYRKWDKNKLFLGKLIFVLMIVMHKAFQCSFFLF